MEGSGSRFLPVRNLGGVIGPAVITALYFLCFGALFGLAVFIYRRDPNEWLNRYFVLFSLSILAWLATLYAFNRHGDTPGLTQLGRLNFAVAALIVLFGYLFVREVTTRRGKRRLAITARWLFAETVCLFALTLSTGWLDNAEHLEGGQHVTAFGPLFPLFILHIGGYILAALYLAFVAGRHASPKVRAQLSIIGLGIFVMAAIAVVTNLLLPYLYKEFAFQEVGALSTLALLSAIAYAISVHHLFDVRIFIRRAVVFTLYLGSISAASNALIFILTLLFQGTFGVYDWRTTLPVALIFSTVSFIFEPIRNRLDLSVSRVLYRQEQERQEALRLLAQNLNTAETLDDALEMLMRTLVSRLRLSHAVTYVFQPGEEGKPAIKRIKQVGHPEPDSLALKEDSPFIGYFTRHPEILNAEALKVRLAEEQDLLKAHEAGHSSRQWLSAKGTTLPPKVLNWKAFAGEHAEGLAISPLLEELRASMVIPLFLGQQPLGVILLSGKESGAPYTPEDEWLLETIAAQAVNSIQKAKLLENDQMKTEFVSIASHELLTPITAMQGFLSMILVEHLGKVDPQAEGYLQHVYDAANRLAALVKDLLSASRIESGKIKIEPRRLDLGKLIDETMAQLQFKAAEKSLKLAHVQPAQGSLPPVFADPDRTMEVLMNLVGNAIKYTPAGSVTVTTAIEDGPKPLLRVDISDTGLGMTKEAQAHLFEKFYRVATPETQAIPGTGLGLYITKSEVEKMGGALWVDSTPGKGSTFSFTLPLFQVENVGEKAQ